MATETEQNIIKAKLCLLARRMKLHEWTDFTGAEADELEAEEERIDSGEIGQLDEECRTD